MDFLFQQGVTVKVHNPVAKLMSDQGNQFESIEEAVSDADAALICTDWLEYKKFAWESVTEKMKQSIILDGRNRLNAEERKRLGFIYTGVSIFNFYDLIL